MPIEGTRASRTLAWYLRIGVDPEDDPEVRLRKILVLSVAAMLMPLALVWGGVYLWLGAPHAAAVPWAYVVLSIFDTALFAAHRNLTWFAVGQLVPYLVFPFVVMWVLGGYVEGSVVALWAGVAPIAAVILSGPRTGIAWLIGFIALLVLVGLGDPKPTDLLPARAIDAFFVLNMAGVALVTFGGVAAYTGGRGAILTDTRRLIERYFSPAVAASLLAEPERSELGGELVEVTVLFADLRGFTTFSERSTPGAVVELLNRYFGRTIPAIHAHGGTTVALAGDEVMAIFNAPERQPDHAARAVHAARAIHEAVGSVARPGEPGFGIGINTGEVIVGNIGGEGFRNFTVIGDAINTAARLQAEARAGEVVVGPRTAELLGYDESLVHRGPLALKGKAEPVETFVLTT